MLPIKAMRMRAPASSGGLWTPANLTMQPFFRLSPDSAVTDAGSGALAQWDDVFASGKYFEQTVSGERPQIISAGLNGLRTVRADGSNDTLRAAGTNQKGIYRNTGYGYFFFVWKRTVSTGGGSSRVVWAVPRSSSTAAHFVVLVDSAAAPNKLSLQIRRLNADSSPTIVNGNTDINSGWHMALVEVNWSLGRVRFYVDGSLDKEQTGATTTGTTTDADAFDQPRFFSSSVDTAYADVEVAEAIAGRFTELTAGEIDKLFGYAAHRYALTSLLPGGHPYKTVAPTI